MRFKVYRGTCGMCKRQFTKRVNNALKHRHLCNRCLVNIWKKTKKGIESRLRTYQKIRKKVLSYNKKYNDEHREKIRDYRKKYYWTHRDEINEYQRKNYQNAMILRSISRRKLFNDILGMPSDEYAEQLKKPLKKERKMNDDEKI